MDDNLTPREQRSVEEATNDAKRKVEKFQKMRKIIKTVIKVVAVVGHSMPLMLGGIILAFLIIVPILGVPLDLYGSGDLEEDMQAANTTNSNTDMTAEDWQLIHSEVIGFISNYDSDNTTLKSELMKRANKIIEWQENYGYSATLLITIAFEEGKTAEELDDFLNEMNEKAAKWNEAGYKTINDIAKDYVGDETAQEWANNIANKMQETAQETGIIEGGEKQVTGDGYDSVYVSKSGKTYRNYKQIKGSYANHVWIRYTNSSGQEVTSTIYRDGCCLTSIAVIVSGYNDADITPKDIVMTISNGAGYLSSFAPASAMSAYGVGHSRPYYHRYTELSEEQKQEIIKHLNTERPVIIYVLGQNGVRDGNGNLLGKGNSAFTNSQHWMALLDYNEETNEVYVSNPSATDNGKTGWIDADYVLRSCTEYMAITN